MITGVEPDSIAEELGIEPGDKLVSIGGVMPKDVFDYRYIMDSESLEVCVEKPDGQAYIYEVEKYADEDLGLCFETALMDKPARCSNKCIFCFIDQLPPGMRESLYFKDDDIRLSFLQGNYVTLTNISDAEFARLMSYHLSPINISVHAMDPALRARIMLNPKAADISKRLDALRDARIEMNFQIVLMKGINDGAYMDDTIRALGAYMPLARSLSVVPVGLTKFRAGLPYLQTFTKQDAARVLEQVRDRNAEFKREHGTSFVYAADEFYLKAEERLPAYDYYEDFPQIENGVGMLTALDKEFRDAMAARRATNMRAARTSVVTGKAAFSTISRLADISCKKFGLDINTICVDNRIFGEDITVSGLLTGGDISSCLSELSREELGERVLLPLNMFRSGTDTFLDGTTAAQLAESLSVTVSIVETRGQAFLEAILS